MTDDEFRLSPLRPELEMILNNSTFRTAIALVMERRQRHAAVCENVLTADPIASVRLNNQRVGAEGLIFDLQELAAPMTPAPSEDRPEFGHPDAAQKLAEYNES